MSTKNPKLIIILSGKRKSGKDHASTLISNHVGPEGNSVLAILCIGGSIKREFANNNRLDFERLLDSSSYKEDHRVSMVEWSERYREKEGWNCFLEQAIEEQRAIDKPIWILNDARRACDVEYFENNPAFSGSKIIKIRIEATEETRASRGWEFVDGIDNANTECGLDSYKDWTLVINNNHNDETILSGLREVFDEINLVMG